MPGRYILTIPLLIIIHALTGISAAGVTVSSGNIGLKLAPRGRGTTFLAMTTLVNSLAAGIAPVLGGRFADFFAERELSWTLRWTSPEGEFTFQTLNLQQWDFFFLLAFLIGLYSVHRLALVNETGSIKERVVVQELIAEVRKGARNLSTVGGLLHLTQFPLSILRMGRREKD
jgi:MFS family permease